MSTSGRSHIIKLSLLGYDDRLLSEVEPDVERRRPALESGRGHVLLILVGDILRIPISLDLVKELLVLFILQNISFAKRTFAEARVIVLASPLLSFPASMWLYEYFFMRNSKHSMNHSERPVREERIISCEHQHSCIHHYLQVLVEL